MRKKPPPVGHNVVDFPEYLGVPLPPELEVWADTAGDHWAVIQRLLKIGSPKTTAMLLAGHAAQLLVENGLDVAEFCDDVKAEAYSHPGVVD